MAIGSAALTFASACSCPREGAAEGGSRAIECSDDALGEIVEGFSWTLHGAHGDVLVDGLLEGCYDSLPPEVRATLKMMAERRCNPEALSVFPPDVEQFLDLTSLEPATRAKFGGPYRLMLGDCLHRVPRAHIPMMGSGSPTREDDVEIGLTEGKRFYRGSQLPDDMPLTGHLPQRTPSPRFVVAASADDESGDVIRLLAEGSAAGFSEFGLLVRDEYEYKVVPVSLGSPLDEYNVHVGFIGDGFIVRSTPSDGGEAPSPSRPPDLSRTKAEVPILKPGADFYDAFRWDWDGFDQVLAEHTRGAPRSLTASITVYSEILVTDLLTLLKHLRGPDCDPSSSPCRFSKIGLMRTSQW